MCCQRADPCSAGKTRQISFSRRSLVTKSISSEAATTYIGHAKLLSMYLSQSNSTFEGWTELNPQRIAGCKEVQLKQIWGRFQAFPLDYVSVYHRATRIRLYRRKTVSLDIVGTTCNLAQPCFRFGDRLRRADARNCKFVSAVCHLPMSCS